MVIFVTPAESARKGAVCISATKALKYAFEILEEVAGVIFSTRSV